MVYFIVINFQHGAQIEPRAFHTEQECRNYVREEALTEYADYFQAFCVYRKDIGIDI